MLWVMALDSSLFGYGWCLLLSRRWLTAHPTNPTFNPPSHFSSKSWERWCITHHRSTALVRLVPVGGSGREWRHVDQQGPMTPPLVRLWEILPNGAQIGTSKRSVYNYESNRASC